MAEHEYFNPPSTWLAGDDMIYRIRDGNLYDGVQVLTYQECDDHAARVAGAEQLLALVEAGQQAAAIHAHITWLHGILRESGRCIDGGKCHHGCQAGQPCSRQRTCAPLQGSGLGDDWRVPAQLAEDA